MSLVSFTVLCLSAAAARADPIVFTADVATHGVFTCGGSIACTGSGTNSITLGSGSNTATLTFSGIDTTFRITNRTMRVSLGEIESTSSPGFTFPERRNPNTPVFSFRLSVEHSSPVPGTSSKLWRFGPGGGSTINLFGGSSHFALRSGSDQYRFLVYTVTPFPFTLSSNGLRDIPADVGAVPEPATMMLLGTGLAGAALARRRKRAE